MELEILGNWVTKGVPSFAKGLHVLVVDHDKESLQSIASMLECHSYKVTTTELANAALTMILEEKDQPFKLVMANACIPDTNSLSFLHFLLQMDIPVILMFSEIDMNMAYKATAELGCRLLEKPISMEDIELVWQHVYRKSRNPITKELSRKENREENVNINRKKSQLGNMIGEAKSMFGKVVALAREVRGNLTEQEGMKEKDGSIGDRCEEMRLNPTADVDLETTKIIEEDKKKDRNDSTSKRRRIVWGSKLHRKFTEALSKLGNRKSSPKVILKMMNEPTLTLRQVASHLQKYKSQVKHLNKTASIIPAATDTSSSLSIIQSQQLLRKQNNVIPTLGQASYSSEIRQYQKLHVFNCFKGPKLPFGNDLACDLRMLNQNHSNSYGTNEPNDLQPEAYGRFEGINHREDNCTFACGFNMEENSECFVQTSQSNLQHSSADVDYPFLSADNQCPHAILELDFAQNLGGFSYPQNQNQHVMESSGKTEELLLISGKILSSNLMDVDNLAANVTDGNLKLDFASAAYPAPADSSNQNAALKEIDDLLNNTEDDLMGYWCLDGKPNSVDIDQYYEWLST